MQSEKRAIISNVMALFILVIMKIAKFYFVAFLCLINNESLAQDEGELAKATQNPVADMYSLPFQNNTTYGDSPHNTGIQ